MYSLFIDKSTIFECDVQIKNASLKNSFARIILESDDMNLVFNGKIENDKCIIPIKRLKHILSENTTGNISLEIVVEDTLFKPWSDKFSIHENTSVKVRVDEQCELSEKPMVEIKKDSIENVTKPTQNVCENIITVPMNEISSLCKRFGIQSNNFNTSKKTEFRQIIKEYFKINPEYKNHTKSILLGLSKYIG